MAKETVKTKTEEPAKDRWDGVPNVGDPVLYFRAARSGLWDAEEVEPLVAFVIRIHDDENVDLAVIQTGLGGAQPIAWREALQVRFGADGDTERWCWPD